MLSHEFKPRVEGRLQTKAGDCGYNEYWRSVAEQLIHGLDDEGIISEVPR